jgi:hypothetical protein
LEKNCTLFQKNRLSDLKKTKSAIMLSCGLWLIAEKRVQQYAVMSRKSE